ncbi:MAG TPA: glycoside hydrolase family 9 protein, partial [Armatimonadota bacterium]|nr:glycoside hydrolase family 9 protein [Armatimonadota bacterium]
VPRAAVKTVMVVQGLHAHNPGEAEECIYHLGELRLRRVAPETKLHGWELQPDRIAFSHVGYLPGAEKTAILAAAAGPKARLLDADSGQVVWEGDLQPFESPTTGRFMLADFSPVRRPGRYVLVADGADGPLPSEPFFIRGDVYSDAAREVVNFYRAERCGDAAPGYHTACHLDDAVLRPYEGMDPEKFAPEVRALFGQHVNCTGGWHDAGDVAKFPDQEYNSAYQMLRLYERGLRYARGDEPDDALLDEAAWGVQYALNTLLPTGRNCDRPDRVALGVWTNCVPGDGDDRIAGITTWGTVERYVQALAATALGARLLREHDPDLADRCLAQARDEAEAYLTGAMSNWRDKANVAKYSAVGKAMLEMYLTTGEQLYADEATRCGDEVVACQEQGLGWNDQGITGFFYEGPARKYPYGDIPGDGQQAYFLAELCRQFPDHPSWMSWYAAVKIYAHFYALGTSKYLAPYSVPAFSLNNGPDQPRRYWEIVRVDGEPKSQPLDMQYDRLVRVGDRYLIRIRAGNPCLSMHAAALAAAADVCADPEAEAIAQRCLQWLLGRNPLSRSQVWAVGYRYREQPHYVAMHDEMPGSIGCGGIQGRFDGDGVYHDEPWSDPLPRCVINEVHIAASVRFLTAARELALPPTVSGAVRGAGAAGLPAGGVVARFAGSEEVVAQADIAPDGCYSLQLPGGASYEVQCGDLRRRVFVASASDLGDFDLHLDREVQVSLTCPEQVSAGEPFTATIHLQRLAGGAGSHQIDLRLHNLRCRETTRTVEVGEAGEATVTVELAPERAAEPFIIIAVPDGELSKRAEAMGVVG